MKLNAPSERLANFIVMAAVQAVDDRLQQANRIVCDRPLRDSGVTVDISITATAAALSYCISRRTAVRDPPSIFVDCHGGCSRQNFHGSLTNRFTEIFSI